MGVHNDELTTLVLEGEIIATHSLAEVVQRCRCWPCTQIMVTRRAVTGHGEPGFDLDEVRQRGIVSPIDQIATDQDEVGSQCVDLVDGLLERGHVVGVASKAQLRVASCTKVKRSPVAGFMGVVTQAGNLMTPSPSAAIFNNCLREPCMICPGPFEQRAG